MTEVEHLLTCIAEEAAEVAQAATKTLRFAVGGQYPDGRLNEAVLAAELNDLFAVVEMLFEKIELPSLHDPLLIYKKKEKVRQMLEVSKERGTLSE